MPAPHQPGPAGTPAAAPRDPGIYVHVPWCRQHCPYCAFAVRVEAVPAWRAWADGIRRDLDRVVAHLDRASAGSAPARRTSPGLRAPTLYLGGGTPALLPLGLLAELLELLPTAPEAERTLEVDPGTVDAARLVALADLGITRLSLGVQTFRPEHARRLGRGHSAAQASALLRDVARHPPDSWSVDLMFALPGQTLAELDADLDLLIDHQPPHVSLYGLTWEPGTPFEEHRRRGRLHETGPELWRAMYDRIVERLHLSGWERYEVSNFARPGHRSRHNQATWRGAPYVGLGPSAHGFLPPGPGAPHGTRTAAPPDLETWLVQSWESVEHSTAEQAAVDLVLGTLRHVDGLPLDCLEALGHGLDGPTLARLTAAGLVEERGTLLRLGSAGWPVADGVVRHLVETMGPLTSR